MPTYKYRARDRSGRLVSGAAIFEGEEEARAFLRANKLMALELKEEQQRGRSSANWLRRFQRIDLTPVIRQLAIMLRTGVPLDRTFDVLLDQDHHPRLADALRQVTRDVRAGAALSEALQRHPHVFPEMLVSLARAGETGGVLDVSLSEAARQMGWQRELRQKLMTALSYPVFVLVMAGGMVTVMLTVVVPRFAKLYASADQALPLPTQLLLQASNLLVKRTPIVLLIGAAIVWAAKRWIETPAGRRKVDEIKLKLPILGGTIRKIAVANFCRTLALLLDAGVPILQALRVAANSSGSAVIQDAVMDISEEVTRGHLLAQPLQRCGEFPPLVTRLVSVGEITGVLPDVLREVVTVYTQEVDEEFKRAMSMMEPLLMLFLSAVVGGLLVALYMPILQISTLAGR
ncbi:MAG: type II secretion system F family protein [Armatimonadota bacterium]